MTYRPGLLLAIALGMVLVWPASAARAQQRSPSDTVREFYGLLREKRFKQAVEISVFREAIENLSPDDLADLAPEFQSIAADIPSTIKIKGETTSGDVATVFVDLGLGIDESVTLVREDGKWLVGDRETLELVRGEKNAFFFNARMRVNQKEAYKLMNSIVGTEIIQLKARKPFLTLDEYIAMRRVSGEFQDGVAHGYRFTVTLSGDRSLFSISAVPVKYGRTGKLSFFADSSVIKAADRAGQPAGPDAPILEHEP